MNQHSAAAVKSNGARFKPRAGSTRAAGQAARVAQLEAELQTLREEVSLDRLQLEAEQLQQAETQRELEIAAHRYAGLFDFAPVAYVLLDHRGFIRDANLTATAVLGVRRDKLRGTLFSRFLVRSEHRKLLNHLARCRRSQHPAQTASELELILRDGKPLALQLISVPEAEPTGPRPLYRTALIDITGRRQAETAVRAKEAELELLLDTTPFMITRCSRDLHYRYASRAYAAMLGREPAKVAGKPILEIMGRKGFDAIAPHVKAVLQGQRVEYEAPVEFAGTGPRRLHVIYLPDRDRDGAVIGWIASISDVTELRRSEQHERELAAIVESSADAIYSADRDDVITSWNPGAESLYGWRAAEAVGRPMAMLVPTERRKEARELWRLVQAGETVRQLETVRVRKDGSPVDVSFTASPLRDAQGRVLGAGVIARNVTLRKQAERLALEQSEKLERILKAVPAIVWMADDPQCREIYGNAYAARLLGVPRRTNFSQTPGPGVRALRLRHFRRGRELPPAELPMQRAAATGHRQPVEEMDFEFPDGRRLTLAGSAVPLFDERRRVRGAVAAFSDITARKQMEAELHRTAERLELAHDSAPVGTFEWNVRANEINGSASLNRIYGLPKTRPLRHYEQWLKRLHPDELKWLPTAVKQALKKQRRLDVEFRIIRPDGQTRWMDSRQRIFRDERGRAVRVVGVHLDVTDRKRAQEILRQTNQILEQRVRQRTVALRNLIAELHREIAERRQLQGELMEISEREQRRIGQDLHDGLGQQLTGVAMLADTLLDKLRQKRLAETADARRLGGLLQQAREQIRHLARGLQPVAPDPAGLAHSLRRLAETVTGLGVECRFACDPRTVSLRDPVKATHLFRIAQEAVNNALRHARSRRLQLRLLARDGSLRLEIHNDGRPWRAWPNGKPAGQGLRIMKFRSEAMGGQLEIQRPRAGGAAVICVVPAPSRRRKPA